METDSLEYYIRFILYSILVIGILLVILKYSKKIQKNNLTKDIKIIDRVQTSNQANIFLLEVRNNTYLVGATNQNINIIDKL